MSIKRGRWLLLRNRDNLNARQVIKLDERLAANAPLISVYLIETQLEALWFAPTVSEARQRWQDWYR